MPVRIHTAEYVHIEILRSSLTFFILEDAVCIIEVRLDLIIDSLHTCPCRTGVLVVNELKRHAEVSCSGGRIVCLAETSCKLQIGPGTGGLCISHKIVKGITINFPVEGGHRHLLNGNVVVRDGNIEGIPEIGHILIG